MGRDPRIMFGVPSVTAVLGAVLVPGGRPNVWLTWAILTVRARAGGVRADTGRIWGEGGVLGARGHRPEPMVLEDHQGS